MKEQNFLMVLNSIKIPERRFANDTDLDNTTTNVSLTMDKVNYMNNVNYL
jgi:hypothetical protein